MIVVAGMVTISGAVLAKEKVRQTTVVNKFQKPVNVAFIALGCFVSCKAEKVNPGGSITYRWKWGQTGRKVIIEQEGRFFRSKGDIKESYEWTGFRTMSSNEWIEPK